MIDSTKLKFYHLLDGRLTHEKFGQWLYQTNREELGLSEEQFNALLDFDLTDKYSS